MTALARTQGPPPRNPRPLLATLATLLVLALALWGLCLRPPAGGSGGTGGSGMGDGVGAGAGAGSGDGGGEAFGAGGGQGEAAVDAATVEAAAGGAPAPAVDEPAAAALATPVPASTVAADAPEPEPPLEAAADGIRLTTVGRGAAADEGRGRAAAAGGRRGRGLGTGDLSFRLYWKPLREDLDLHVVDPKGHRLSFQKPSCPCSGKMDRDDTVEGGPENIFWPRGTAPKGVYRVQVEFYAGTGAEQFTVEVRHQDQLTQTLTGMLQKKGELSQEFEVSY